MLILNQIFQNTAEKTYFGKESNTIWTGLAPEYNILKIAAGSFKGFKHSEATKKTISLKKQCCFR